MNNKTINSITVVQQAFDMMKYMTFCIAMYGNTKHDLTCEVVCNIVHIRDAFYNDTIHCLPQQVLRIIRAGIWRIPQCHKLAHLVIQCSLYTNSGT